ncbi:MAG: class I SAM-dependent methyltransferase [Candidatus Limnocylindrales bacterium]
MTFADQSWESAVEWLKAQPDQVDLVRACFFDDPLIGAAQRYHASAEWAGVQELIGVGPGRVLDVGAGRGMSSYALARDGWTVTALEPDPSAVIGAGAIRELAATAGLSIEVVEEWGEALPFPDGTFDLVYGRQVLHHARDLTRLCAEMARVLRPGGSFLATREHVIFKDGDLAVFLAEHPLHRLYGGEHAYRLSAYRRAIESAGIRLTRVINPWASDINLHPRTIAEVARLIHERVRVIPVAWLTPGLLRWAGAYLRSPGTNYSFYGTREAR